MLYRLAYSYLVHRSSSSNGINGIDCQQCTNTKRQARAMYHRMSFLADDHQGEHGEHGEHELKGRKVHLDSRENRSEILHLEIIM